MLRLLQVVRDVWRAAPAPIPGPGEPLLVAVSGGRDSVVLARVLAHFGAEVGLALHVAHFNHRFRGRASDADEAFVAGLASSLGVPCHTESRMAGEVRRRGESLEMQARRLRHGFLARTCREIGATVVVLGHHSGDQLETFLLRLLRGSAPGALAGMAPWSRSPSDPSIQLFRPFLEVPATELERVARRGRWAHREDASNADEQMDRNWIRRQLVPLLRRRYGAGVDRVLMRSAALIADTELGLEALIRARRRGRPFRLASSPVAVQRLVIKQALEDAGLGSVLTFRHVELLRTSGGKPLSLAGRSLRCDPQGRLECLEPAARGFVPDAVTVDLSDGSGDLQFLGCRVRWRVIPRRGLPFGPGREYFDARKLGRRLELRCWRPGDRFQPLGFPCPAKLQDQFTNRKIPAGERRLRLLGTARGGILWWVEGFPPGERFKVSPGTRHVLEWRVERVGTVPLGTGAAGTRPPNPIARP